MFSRAPLWLSTGLTSLHSAGIGIEDPDNAVTMNMANAKY